MTRHSFVADEDLADCAYEASQKAPRPRPDDDGAVRSSGAHGFQRFALERTVDVQTPGSVANVYGAHDVCVTDCTCHATARPPLPTPQGMSWLISSGQRETKRAPAVVESMDFSVRTQIHGPCRRNGAIGIEFLSPDEHEVYAALGNRNPVTLVSAKSRRSISNGSPSRPSPQARAGHDSKRPRVGIRRESCEAATRCTNARKKNRALRGDQARGSAEPY